MSKIPLHITIVSIFGHRQGCCRKPFAITRKHQFHLILGQIKFAMEMQNLWFILLQSRDTLFICELDLHSHFTANLKNRGNIYFRRPHCGAHTSLVYKQRNKWWALPDYSLLSDRIVLNGTTYSLPLQTSNCTKSHTFLKNLYVVFIKFKKTVT